MKKCTYKIFPLWQIDCDFSTNRRVYLGKKGSRDLNQPDAPEKTGSSETGKVTDHASSSAMTRSLRVSLASSMQNKSAEVSENFS